eukprot:CAMPEP_0114123184 /NCGR_PEP_ID=MMETSP0043_2-20121206/8088_1 /TAXON_ID=464988 /ORGANISM="Hemiselmis andersenii, Strain CCMP644" /LENGTH=360 /DNA_ID=CAMNT_0001215939 /DNA_START=133 /DNA_END=1215 /DNA_ORIENTATION=-
MWVVLDDIQRPQAILSVPPPADSPHRDLSDTELSLFMESGRLSVYLMGALYDRELSLAEGGVMEELKDGVPMQIALTYDPATSVLDIYTGGRWLAGFPGVPPLNEAAGPLLVGHCNCTYKGASPQMVGTADSILVYDRPLTREDVTALHNILHVTPSLERPFPVQAITVPSEPAAIESVRVWRSGVLSVTVAPPLDPGSGPPGSPSACALGAPPPCTSVIRYKLELDDNPDFDSVEWQQVFHVPEFGGEGGARWVNGTGKALTQGGEGTVMGSSPDSFSDSYEDGRFLHLWAESVPVSQWLYVRVSASNSVGYGPPQTLSINGTEPSSVRMSGAFYLQRVQQGFYVVQERSPPDAFWGEL